MPLYCIGGTRHFRHTECDARVRELSAHREQLAAARSRRTVVPIFLSRCHPGKGSTRAEEPAAGRFLREVGDRKRVAAKIPRAYSARTSNWSHVQHFRFTPESSRRDGPIAAVSNCKSL